MLPYLGPPLTLIRLLRRRVSGLFTLLFIRLRLRSLVRLRTDDVALQVPLPAFWSPVMAISSSRTFPAQT